VGYKAIMVHLELSDTNDGLLQIAGDLAERLHAEVLGIAGCQPIQLAYADTYFSGDIVVSDRTEIEKELQRAEANFRAVVAARGLKAEWRSTICYQPLADYIAHEARAADLIITGPDIGGATFDSTRRVSIADLVMQAGRPVLIVPEKRKKMSLNHVVVGWKGSRESRRVIVDALPLMKLAGKVTVLEIAPEAELPRAKDSLADVCSWLKRHGISASAEAVAAKGQDSARFSELAHEMGADLIVAGAYGHSRLREWVLGGVTYDFLLNPDRCVLVSH
jgi:nucleotide-binding universal stress UspA family protein